MNASKISYALVVTYEVSSVTVRQLTDSFQMLQVQDGMFTQLHTQVIRAASQKFVALMWNCQSEEMTSVCL